MGKTQYFYNKETCNYEEIRPSKRRITRNITFYLLGAALLAAGTLISLSFHIQNPKQTRLETEQLELEYQWKLLESEMVYLDQLVKDLWITDEEMRTILELDSLPQEIRSAGVGGSEELNEFGNQKLFFESKIKKAYEQIQKLKAQLKVQNASLDTLMSYAKERDKFWMAMPAIMPVDINDIRRYSTVYGMRLNPILNKWMPHNGFDFMGDVGIPIYATGNGQVRLSQMTYGGFGNLVVIDHGYGYQTYYAHLDNFTVKKGEKVKRGELIGYMGNTGRSAGPHLHYEVHKDRMHVNPIGFFEREMGGSEAFAELLKKAKQSSQPLDW